jgi:hypothetical protein
MGTPRIRDLEYNPVSQAFEGDVTLRLGIGWETYSCRFRAPLSTGYAAVVSGLVADARRQAKAKRWCVPADMSGTLDVRGAFRLI